MKKIWYIQWNIIQPYKKKGVPGFLTTWMDLEGIRLNEISQTEKSKYCMISLMGNLKISAHRDRVKW